MSEKPPKRPYFFLSLTFHLGLILLGAVVSTIHPTTRDLIIPSIQIDVVGLPMEVKQEESEPVDLSLPVKDAGAPHAAPKPPSPEEMKPIPDKKVTEKDALSALDKMRKAQDKERKENLKKQAKEILDKKKADLKDFEDKYRKALAGNQKATGNSSTGAVSTEVRNAYLGHIVERVRANWSLPVWLQTQGLSARVQIFIDASGNIYGHPFLKTSGNDVFDEKVITAIKLSSPLAPPPEEMTKELRSGTFTLKFPL